MSRPDDDVLGVFDATPFKVEWTDDGHATEESLHAWLDGALSGDDGDAVERHVATCQTCSAAVADARGLIAAAVRIMHEADVSPRNVVAPHDVVRTAARVAASTDRTRAPMQRRMRATTLTQIAAGVLVMIAGAVYVTGRNENGAAVETRASTVASATTASRDPDSATPASAVPPQPSESPRIESVVPQAKARARQPSSAEVAVAPPSAGPDLVVAALPPTPVVEASVPTPVVEASVRRSAADVEASAPSTVTGRVTSGAVPLAFTQVMVPGTSIGTMTDSMGRFTLRAVPATATTLLARRIGYDATTKSLLNLASDTTSVDIELKATDLQLSAVMVTSERSAIVVRNLRCLVAVQDTATGRVPFVRLLRGTLRSRGEHTLTIVGWPTPGERTAARFVLDSEDVLRGTASTDSATIAFELRADDPSWFGTVTETRGTNARQEEVRFLADTSSQRCAQNE